MQQPSIYECARCGVTAHGQSAPAGWSFQPGIGLICDDCASAYFAGKQELATIAERSFRRAQGAASKAIAAGRMNPGEAEARLRPWLAIAAAAGADLPQLIEHFTPLFWSGEGPAPDSRRIPSDQICPRAEWVPVLVETRAAAIDRHAADPSSENAETARDLLALGNALAFTGQPAIPPFMPVARDERIAA